MAQKQKVACLMADGFDDTQFKVSYARLLDEGFDVEIIGQERGRQIRGCRGKETALVDRDIERTRPQDYALLFIPGGQSPDLLRGDERFVELVRQFEKSGRPVAAIGHGAQLLLTAGLVKGRSLTATKTVQGDLKYAGASVQDAGLVLDKNWLTSRSTEDLTAFTEGMVKLLR